MSTPGNLGSLAGGRSLQRVALDYTGKVETAERLLREGGPGNVELAATELASALRDNAAFMGTVMALLETLRPKTEGR